MSKSAHQLIRVVQGEGAGQGRRVGDEIVDRLWAASAARMSWPARRQCRRQCLDPRRQFRHVVSSRRIHQSVGDVVPRLGANREHYMQPDRVHCIHELFKVRPKSARMEQPMDLRTAVQRCKEPKKVHSGCREKAKRVKYIDMGARTSHELRAAPQRIKDVDANGTFELGGSDRTVLATHSHKLAPSWRSAQSRRA